MGTVILICRERNLLNHSRGGILGKPCIRSVLEQQMMTGCRHLENVLRFIVLPYIRRHARLLYQHNNACLPIAWVVWVFLVPESHTANRLTCSFASSQSDQKYLGCDLSKTSAILASLG